MVTITKSSPAKCWGVGKSCAFSPPCALSSCNVEDQSQLLWLPGKCSGYGLSLQIDVELTSTDSKIAGSGYVYRTLNINPLYVPDFLDMEVKTGLHREAYINIHMSFLAIRCNFRQPRLSVYRETKYGSSIQWHFSSVYRKEVLTRTTRGHTSLS